VVDFDGAIIQILLPEAGCELLSEGGGEEKKKEKNNGTERKVVYCISR